MPQNIPTPWERLQEIIREKGYGSIKQFADIIGLKRAETLYQIKRGQQGISKRLAAQILGALPDVDEAYLLTGRRADKSVLVPYYIRDALTRYRGGMPPDNYISMPYSSAPPLSLATVNNEPEPVRGVFPNTVIMLEETSPEHFIHDRPHLIETASSLILRNIGDDEATGHYRLWSDNKQRADIILPAPEIKSIFALRYALGIY